MSDGYSRPMFFHQECLRKTDIQRARTEGKLGELLLNALAAVVSDYEVAFRDEQKVQEGIASDDQIVLDIKFLACEVDENNVPIRPKDD